jgi:hypothetical protein
MHLLNGKYGCHIYLPVCFVTSESA